MSGGAHGYESTGPLAARVRVHELYGVNPEPWPDWVWQRVAVRGDDEVLEVGCGPGALWRGREIGGARVVCSDASRSMTRAAAAALGDRASVVRCDVAALPFAGARFSLVVANHMLYHAADPAAAVGEIRRVLRPGGRLAASCNGLRHMQEIDALVGASVNPAESFGLENGPEMLRRHFESVTVARYEDELRITNAAHVVDYAASILGERPPVEDDVAARIAEIGHFRVSKDSGILLAR